VPAIWSYPEPPRWASPEGGAEGGHTSQQGCLGKGGEGMEGVQALVGEGEGLDPPSDLSRMGRKGDGGERDPPAPP